MTLKKQAQEAGGEEELLYSRDSTWAVLVAPGFGWQRAVGRATAGSSSAHPPQKGILLPQASQEKTETRSQSWLRVLRIRGAQLQSL